MEEDHAAATDVDGDLGGANVVQVDDGCLPVDQRRRCAGRRKRRLGSKHLWRCGRAHHWDHDYNVSVYVSKWSVDLERIAFLLSCDDLLVP